jgi:hypothetical protein
MVNITRNKYTETINMAETPVSQQPATSFEEFCNACENGNLSKIKEGLKLHPDWSRSFEAMESSFKGGHDEVLNLMRIAASTITIIRMEKDISHNETLKMESEPTGHDVIAACVKVAIKTATNNVRCWLQLHDHATESTDCGEEVLKSNKVHIPPKVYSLSESDLSCLHKFCHLDTDEITQQWLSCMLKSTLNDGVDSTDASATSETNTDSAADEKAFELKTNFIAALKGNHLEDMLKCIDQGLELDHSDIVEHNMHTIACENGWTAIVRYLLTHGLTNDMIQADNRKLMCLAAKGAHIKVLRLLVNSITS